MRLICTRIMRAKSSTNERICCPHSRLDTKFQHERMASISFETNRIQIAWLRFGSKQESGWLAHRLMCAGVTGKCVALTSLDLHPQIAWNHDGRRSNTIADYFLPLSRCPMKKQRIYQMKVNGQAATYHNISATKRNAELLIEKRAKPSQVHILAILSFGCESCAHTVWM